MEDKKDQRRNDQQDRRELDDALENVGNHWLAFLTARRMWQR
jgi:hypothetical protein